ncbi:MAG: SDR family oxidoreductase [Actinomycetota bacterium]|nr:SDR family oxidoreductase [Actinomycetota bacterium]
MKPARPPIDGGTILITGASSGIGRELARQLAPRARNLVLVARRAGRLEDLRPELEAKNPHLAVYIAACDLADEDATGSMLDWVSGRVGAVDVLVNNAGIGDQHLYDKADWARVRRVLQVNILTPALLTHRLVPQMVERGRGGVLNVGSGAGHSFLPGAAAYTGTKHFVDGFTETLHLELVEAGVAVTQVCPGPVETEFDQAADMEGLAGGPPKFLTISADRCARETIRGFERGNALIFPGFPYRAIMPLVGFIPRFLQRRTARSTARDLRNAASQL